jgi:2-iminoacetate synthase
MFTIPDFKQLQKYIDSSSLLAVQQALTEPHCGLAGFAALLSPAADECLSDIAARAAQITAQRFGNTIQIYAPLYLSSYCSNQCVYCGFSAENDIDRRVLTIEEAVEEAMILHNRGISHILLGFLFGKTGRVVKRYVCFHFY